MKTLSRVRTVFQLRQTELQQPNLRIDFLGQSAPWSSSCTTVGPEKSQASTNRSPDLITGKLGKKKRNYGVCFKLSVSWSYFMPNLSTASKLLTTFLLSNSTLCAVGIHLTELHRIGVHRIGVPWLPADQGGVRTARALPLLDHWRRWHFGEKMRTLLFPL